MNECPESYIKLARRIGKRKHPAYITESLLTLIKKGGNDRTDSIEEVDLLRGQLLAFFDKSCAK